MTSLRELIKRAAVKQPLPHQERVALKFDQQVRPGKGLLVDHATGTGKTGTSIIAAQRTGKPLIAVVPASLRENYRAGLKEFGFKGDAQVISYQEALKLQNDPEFQRKTRDSVVVFDEAHRAGRSGSKASELPRSMQANKKMLLTGTAIRNHPSELVPLLRAITDDPSVTSVEKFKENYIHEQAVAPSLLAKIRGATGGTEEVPKNLDQLAKVLKGVVDHQSAESADGESHRPTVTEEQVMVPMSKAQNAAYQAIMNKNPSLAYKLRYGIPPGKEDFGKYKSFLTGLRQASNTPTEFQNKGKPEDAAKIVQAADEIQHHMGTTENYRGYSYSNYLKSGIQPLQEELARRGIKAAVFTGKMNDKQKKDIVSKYNKGEIQHLILSSSGAEGLDLKGTKLVQILEPHWNNAKIDQVKARGVRYKSHAHLPDTERNVHVQHFFSHQPQNPIHKFLGMKPDVYADEAIHRTAKRKDKLNKAFLELLSNTPNGS